jgi:hypothetical protein
MISGKIARILSDSEIVLNIGSQDGVEVGMEFVIYSEDDHIIDPVTGEDLGALETVKGRVKVTHVMEKLSRAETLTYRVESPLSSLASYKSPLFYTETRKRKLQVKQEQVVPAKDDLVVKIGDAVRSLEP